MKVRLSIPIALLATLLLLLFPHTALASNPVVTSTISVGPNPVDIAVSPSGEKAYVLLGGNPGSVKVVNLADNSVDATTFTVQNGPNEIAISPDGTFAYVNNYSSNSVTRIKLTAPQSVSHITGFFDGPRFVVFSPDGTRAYVSNQNVGNNSTNGSVTVLDTSNNSLVSYLAVAGNPQSLAINSAGTTLYSSHVGPRRISIVNITENSYTSLSTGASGEPSGIALSANGSRLYVAMRSADSVIYTSTANPDSFTAITGFSEDPETVALNPLTGQLFVPNPTTGTVMIIDGDSRVSPTLTVESGPRAIAFTPNGLKAFVVNNTSGTLSIISYYQARTLAFSGTSFTNSYGTTRTVAATPSLGEGTGTISYALDASSDACSVDNVTGEVTFTKGSGTCVVKASITEGGTTVSNAYASAETTIQVTFTVEPAPLSLTATSQTVAPGVTINTSYTITSGRLVSPDNLSGVTYTYEGTGGTVYAASTSPPTEIGTYSVTPSLATFTSGDANNYDIDYLPGTLTIADAPPSPSPLSNTTSGSTTRAATAPAPAPATQALATTGATLAYPIGIPLAILIVGGVLTLVGRTIARIRPTGISRD